MSAPPPESTQVERAYANVVKFGVLAGFVLALILLLAAAGRAATLREIELNQTATAVAILNWTDTPSPTTTPDAQATAERSTLQAVLHSIATQTALPTATRTPTLTPTASATPDRLATAERATLQALMTDFQAQQVTGTALAAQAAAQAATIEALVRQARATLTPDAAGTRVAATLAALVRQLSATQTAIPTATPTPTKTATLAPPSEPTVTALSEAMAEAGVFHLDDLFAIPRARNWEEYGQTGNSVAFLQADLPIIVHALAHVYAQTPDWPWVQQEYFDAGYLADSWAQWGSWELLSHDVDPARETLRAEYALATTSGEPFRARELIRIEGNAVLTLRMIVPENHEALIDAMEPALWAGFVLLATPTPTATVTPSRTPSPTPTRTPSPTRTPTATPSPTPTRTPSPTRTPTRTPSPTRTPTARPSPTTTATPTRTPTATPSPTPTRTPSPAATPTETRAAGAPAVGAPVITAPVDGAVVERGEVQFEGTADPGASILIVDPAGEPVGGVTAGASGAWQVPVPLEQRGVYTFAAAVVDIDGKTLARSQPVTITVEIGVEVTPPVITRPVSGSRVSAGVLTIAGVADPNVIVMVMDERGQTLDGAYTDGIGAWTASAVLDEPGDHTLIAVVTDSDGNELARSAPVTVTVRGALARTPTATPSPTGTQVAMGTATALFSLAAALTGTPALAVAPVILAPADGASLAVGANTFSGTAPPGGAVQLVDDVGNVLGSTTADQSGLWRADVELARVGEISVTARLTGATGEGAPLASAPVTVAVIKPIAPQTGAAEWSASETARAVGVVAVALLAAMGAAFALVGSTLRAAVRDGLARWLSLRPPRSRK